MYSLIGLSNSNWTLIIYFNIFEQRADVSDHTDESDFTGWKSKNKTGTITEFHYICRF